MAVPTPGSGQRGTFVWSYPYSEGNVKPNIQTEVVIEGTTVLSADGRPEIGEGGMLSLLFRFIHDGEEWEARLPLTKIEEEGA